MLEWLRSHPWSSRRGARERGSAGGRGAFRPTLDVAVACATQRMLQRRRRHVPISTRGIQLTWSRRLPHREGSMRRAIWIAMHIAALGAPACGHSGSAEDAGGAGGTRRHVERTLRHRGRRRMRLWRSLQKLDLQEAEHRRAALQRRSAVRSSLRLRAGEHLRDGWRTRLAVPRWARMRGEPRSMVSAERRRVRHDSIGRSRYALRTLGCGPIRRLQGRGRRRM
jgi:hypothetical protein